MNLPATLDLPSLRQAYDAGTLTPSALVEAIDQRIERLADPAIWIHRLPLEAMRECAREVEARGRSGQPLFGVPFAIKDNIDLAGIPTTAACPEFAYVPPESAPVVQRLIDAGAIPVGKANLDQFATGLVGVRSPYGTPRNPFDSEFIPGGSSSGSAVAVATGLVSFALGTDTAGSGRVPAALNNLVGLKPTRGALSTRGVVPACRSLDCVSIFALTCADADAVRQVVTEFDAADPFSRQPGALNVDSSIRTIGVPAAADLDFDGGSESATQFAEAVTRLKELGWNVVEVDFAPFRETAALLYQGPWLAERRAGLRDFLKDRAASLHPVTRRILDGAVEMKATEAFLGLHRLAELVRAAESTWAQIDALAVPSVPRPYRLSEVATDALGPNTRLGTYTNFVNLMDLSALALPAGFLRGGMPTGITLIAPAWAEQCLLDCGSRWEAALNLPVGATGIAVKREALGDESGKSIPAKQIAVVGAHLDGLPLNHQLTDRGGRLAWRGRTTAEYRLYELPGAKPPKPGLVRVAEGGAAVEVEVWELATKQFGDFVAAIPAPLGIGTIRLENGESVQGFLCEAVAVAGARDITEFGGWRAWLARGSGRPK